jgi:hypothetical protein
VANVPSGVSLTPLQETKKKKNVAHSEGLFRFRLGDKIQFDEEGEGICDKFLGSISSEVHERKLQAIILARELLTRE